jgi:transposase
LGAPSGALHRFRPLTHAFRLTSKVLAMDETPIKAGRKSKGKTKQGYYWPIFGDQQEVAFSFARSRAHNYAAEILGEYCGKFHLR